MPYTNITFWRFINSTLSLSILPIERADSTPRSSRCPSARQKTPRSSVSVSRGRLLPSSSTVIPSIVNKGSSISLHTKAVLRTSVSIFDEKAAPVANIIASVTAGDAKLRRDKAPSTMVRSTPRRRLFAIFLLRVNVSAAPVRRTLPLVRARAVTRRPSTVCSLEMSSISATKCFCKKNCSAVVKIISGYMVISGFCVRVTASTVSPSIPIDVIAMRRRQPSRWRSM